MDITHMHPPQSQAGFISSTHLIINYINAIQNTMERTSQEIASRAAPPIRKDIISSLPNEIVCQIAGNLYINGLRSLRDANPREFGAPLNKLIRDEHLLHDTSYMISAMFEAAAKRDVKMIRWLFENEKAIGQILLLNQPHPSYAEEKMFRIQQNEKTYWYFCLTGEKLDDETLELILTVGPNLMMAIKTEEALGSCLPPGMVHTYDQYGLILHAVAHSALSSALQATDERRVERFIRLGTSTKLATSRTVNEFIYGSCETDSYSIDWNRGGRWAVIRAEANALFFHTPLEEIDPDHLWAGRNNLLHMAIFSSDSVRMTKFALSKGLCIEADNLAGEWPLQLAFDNEYVPAKVIRVLIEYGADTSVTPSYLTSGYEPGLGSQTKSRREKVAVFLDSTNIDWVAGDLDGNIFGETLLHVAVVWLMPVKYFKSLLKRGMDVNVRDGSGRTPVDVAWDILGADEEDCTWRVLDSEMDFSARRGVLIKIIGFLIKCGGTASIREVGDFVVVVEDLATSGKCDGFERLGEPGDHVKHVKHVAMEHVEYVAMEHLEDVDNSIDITPCDIDYLHSLASVGWD
ncbi:uncharacterized protein H6S33_000104 [Morchella sextelata]|uniref:uncharacterized protein n=1 Tax=Morchella sextelata TaxID=1174677 RepID=UPI001D04AB4A|nr:uncharacterized protein H6S33_000104 [Morchella sextelata]KAH0614468.1 hypothetical protein H6S33_000104 [Morchella sextelata]